jgi:hypothetical protein
MLTYKTFRCRIHANTAADIDLVLNALPPETMIEGYVCCGDEIYITISNYNRYQNEIAQELAKR